MIRAEEVAAILKEAEDSGVAPQPVTDQPEEFLSAFYSAWVKNGGKHRGKNRNSIRKMISFLSGTSEVKSLHPKLKGRTKVKRKDAAAMIGLFLEKWELQQHGDPQTLTSLYVPFESSDIERLRSTLIEAMFPQGSAASRKGIALSLEDSGARGRPVSYDLYRDMLEENNALIVVSRHRIVQRHRTFDSTLQMFWPILKSYTEIMDEQKCRYIIWILDIGTRNVQDPGSWQDYSNVQLLKSQLEAFSSFESYNDTEHYLDSHDDSEDDLYRLFASSSKTERMKYWSILNQYASIIVTNLRDDEIIHLFPEEVTKQSHPRFRSYGLTSEHLLPRLLPVRWSNIPHISNAEKDDLSDATFTVTLKLGDSEDRHRPSVQYSMLALDSKDTRPQEAKSKESPVRQIELPHPGQEFDDAYRLAYHATRYRLKGDKIKREDERSLGGNSINYLRQIGFEVLSIQKFFQLFRYSTNIHE